MNPALSLLVGVVVVLGITAATAYFVAQEFAYMAVDRARLAARAQAGDETAVRTLRITRRTSFMLSGAQLGITVTGLLVGYVAEPLIGQALATLVGGTPSTGAAVAVGGLVALAFSTLVQMLFGELLPKNYSIARADRVSGALSASTRLYLTVFGPLIWLFDKAAELFLRLLRMSPVHDVEHSATASDLEYVVEESRESGALTEELSTMLDRIIDFPRQNVEHAMRPRARVDHVDETTTLAQVRALMASGHTRYPVLDRDEQILGVVHLVDVLTAYAEATGNVEDRPAVSVARDALVVPGSMMLPDVLTDMDRTSCELACVVDEYGGFAGILTREDLAEEIVGEITDEHDGSDEPEEPHLEGDAWVVTGGVATDEVERTLLVDLPEGDYETIAGLVIDAHGDLPAVGDVVTVPLPLDPGEYAAGIEPVGRVLRAEVLAVERHVPARLRLTVQDAESDAESDVVRRGTT